MSRFLKYYLLISGILSIVAISFPPLILLGLYLFVLPGLVLGVAPTAFLYGVVFSLGWFPAKRFLSAWGASAVAAIFTIGVMITLTTTINNHQASELIEARAGDRAPENPVRLFGTVRIELDGDRTVLSLRDDKTGGYACDDLCMAALFTPGVETVVLADVSNQENARNYSAKEPDRTAVYKLTYGSACPQPLHLVSEIVFPLSAWRNLNELQQAWRLALASGHCLMHIASGQEKALPKADWTLRWTDTLRRSYRYRAKNESLFSIQRRRLSLEGPDGRVLQKTEASALRPTLFPYVSFRTGYAFVCCYFELGTYLQQTGSFYPMDVLTKTTNLGTTFATSSAAAATPERVRAVISQALSDPQTPANAMAFSLIEPLFSSMRPPNPRPYILPGDTELIARMLADDRVRKFGAIVLPIRLLGDQAASLRTPMVKRLLRARLPEDKEFSYTIGYALRYMPSGLFASPTPEEKQLLADPVRRLVAGGLIVRQADRGPAAVPDLIKIISEAYPAAHQRHDAPLDAYAALSALCRLGPGANSALPTLVDFIKRGVLKRNELDGNLPVTLVRLGMPIEAVFKLTKPSELNERFLRASVIKKGYSPAQCG